MSENTDETADSGHVGPIIFADETARGQLTEHGRVYTFRKSKRTTGDTWWRTSRTGPKEGDCHVEEVDKIDPSSDALEVFADESGFGSVEEWREAIKSLNGELPEYGYLYRATLPGGESDDF